ncbi:MAG: hypothetical protein P4K98_11000 [Bryobacteraceae bacterium]|nr:hypothetical protein [Bryobacteraceae bacterium]
METQPDARVRDTEAEITAVLDPGLGPVATEPAAHGRRPVLTRIVLAFAIFCLFEGLIFHYGLYARLLKPDSAAGSLRTTLRFEQLRKLLDRNQVLGIGDSRMPLWPRLTDGLRGEIGYTFANIATPGTYPRDWFYMLREVDPDRNRYAAILIPMYEYEDDDWGDHSATEVDIHYLAPLLRLSDLFEFSMSYPTWKLRNRAMRSILLKGLTYKQDFRDLLEHEDARLDELKWVRENLAQTRYYYQGPEKNDVGLEVDWAARKIVQYPPDRTPAERAEFDNILLRPVGAYTGQRAAYRRLWFGRIANYYRGTRTRLIFFRVPRGPFVRPYRTNARTSAVRELAARGEATLLDEDLLDELERPEFFMDAVHLNRAGCERFSPILARAVARVLGPPSGGAH